LANASLLEVSRQAKGGCEPPVHVVSMHLSGLADNKLRDQAKRGLATSLRKQAFCRTFCENAKCKTSG